MKEIYRINKDGKILEDNLKKEKYTSDELLELLRGKDAFSVADVEFAVLEPSGELNVLLKRSPTTHSKRHRFKSSKRKRTTNCYYGWQCLR